LPARGVGGVRVKDRWDGVVKDGERRGGINFKNSLQFIWK